MGDGKNERIFNFSAGPATLPLAVLQQAKEELLCLPGAGASILEISHRSADFVRVLESARKGVVELLGVSDDYDILFLQGGSRLQFSMIPCNLLSESTTADYIVTGSWGKKAVVEAEKEGAVNIAWTGKETGFDRLPDRSQISLSSNSAYVYYTSNEIIEGVQFATEPEAGDRPLVCDASSDFLSRPVALEKHGLFYACAQKNAGPAGVTVVIIKRELLERSRDSLPGYLNFREHSANGSMYNTPPTFAIYLLGLVAEWIQNEFGGLQQLKDANQSKANLLYQAIDASNGFYVCHAQPECRSMMNVCFRLRDEDLMASFLEQATAAGMGSLKGHRSVGGIRASIYNAMPVAGVETLVQFMTDFAQKNG